MSAPKKHALRPAMLAAIVTSAFIAAGCAKQQTPGYYETGPESTLSDAQHQAQGRTMQRAPSQLQLGFGTTQEKPAADTANATTAPVPANVPDTGAALPATIRPLREAKTFLGTTPCLLDGRQNCPATRITLTMAPNGQWRARTVQLDGANPVTTLEQGCWSVVGTNPWRVILETDGKAAKARLTFMTDNVLRIDTINTIRPTLDYRLTRQAEVDGINELANSPALNCRP
ncbi:MAG: hypothetical protein AB7E59_01545 [Pusillimonas sp.]